MDDRTFTKNKQKAFLITDDELSYKNGPYEITGVKLPIEDNALNKSEGFLMILELINNKGDEIDFIVNKNDLETFKIIGYSEIVKSYFNNEIKAN